MTNQSMTTWTDSWYATDPTGSCLRTNDYVSKETFESFECLYPTLAKTYFKFEYPTKSSDDLLKFMDNNTWVPFLAVGLYFLLIFAGQKYMENREALDWRKTLACWNLFLSVFSAVGFFRMAPHLVHNLYHYDFITNICGDGFKLVGFGPTSYYGLIFALSKFFELFDTFFIVIRKKKLMFLHWYHHITVLLMCWHTVVTHTPAGFIFSVVNYGVHMIMYFYYFLMAVRCKPAWFKPVVITVAQILQMVVGVYVCARAWKWAEVDGCHASSQNIKLTLGMYASYLYLFSAFFVQRYVSGVKPKAKTV